jgi:endonuclease YncB( thermonuclease family)
MSARSSPARIFSLITVIYGCVAPLPSRAQSQPPQPAQFAIARSGVAFVTGDTWIQNNQTFRLYGVQSCLRETQFTNVAGVINDCGEASIAYFAALIRDASPVCTPILQVGSPPTIYVVCQAQVGAATLDLSAIIITQGFGFASSAVDGANTRPVYLPYSVAETDAKMHKRGLWAGTFTHPVTALSKVQESR